MHEPPLPAADQKLLDTLFGTAHPNASRRDCLTPEVLDALARHTVPLDDPAYAHLAACSECFCDVRARQTTHAVTQRRHRLIAATVAAGLALVALGIWYGAALITQAPLRDDPGTRETLATRTQLDLRAYRVMRADQPRALLPPLVLTRERLEVRIILPVGAQPGTYDLRVLDGALRSAAEASGTAKLVQHSTVLETRLDLRTLAPGAYRLAVRRHGESWHHYPANIN